MKRHIRGAALFCFMCFFCADISFATESSPAPLSPYVTAGNLIFTSGQVPVDANGKIPDGIEAQVRQTMDNLKAVIESAGGDMGKVVKTTVFLKDFDDFPAMNKIYATYFSGKYPARSTVEVSDIAMDALVEIEAVVMK